jgi:hypothetical protein
VNISIDFPGWKNHPNIDLFRISLVDCISSETINPPGNQASNTCQAFFYQVQYLELEEQPSPLRYHAQWRRENSIKYGALTLSWMRGKRAFCKSAFLDAEGWLVVQPSRRWCSVREKPAAR